MTLHVIGFLTGRFRLFETNPNAIQAVNGQSISVSAKILVLIRYRSKQNANEICLKYVANRFYFNIFRRPRWSGGEGREFLDQIKTHTRAR